MATKRENYETLLTLDSVKANIELVNFINHELELLEKKNKAERGPTANQVENKEIKAYVKAHIGDKAYTVTEMIKGVMNGSQWNEISVSRLTAILTQW